MLKNVSFGLSKNILALLPMAQSANDVTAQATANGLITLDGTATADTAVSLSANGVSLADSADYTFSMQQKSGYAAGEISVRLLGQWLVNGVPQTGALSTIAAASKFAAVSVTYTGRTVTGAELTIPAGTAFSQYAIGLQVETGSTATGWVSPGTQGVVFYPAQGETGAITNTGNVDAYPVIIITGACANPSISNETTGETVSVSLALGNTDTLVIDCRPATRGCYLNGILVFGVKQGLGWIHCPPGDNVMTFSRDGYDTKRHCTISLQGRYL